MRKKDDKVGNKMAYKKKRKAGEGGGGGEESGFFPKNWQLTVFPRVLFSAFDKI